MKYVCCKNCKLPEITHEVVKKNLIGICRSCGTTDNKMDTVHKAGKQLHKDIPSYYQANPEFKVKAAVSITESIGAAAEEAKAARRVNRGKGKKGAAGLTPASSEEQKTTEQLNVERAQKLAETGGEVNRLDAVDLKLSDAEVGKQNLKLSRVAL